MTPDYGRYTTALVQTILETRETTNRPCHIAESFENTELIENIKGLYHEGQLRGTSSCSLMGAVDLKQASKSEQLHHLHFIKTTPSNWSLKTINPHITLNPDVLTLHSA